MLYTRLATAPRSVHTAGLFSYSANPNANLNPNPNPKLTSGMAGGLFPHAVFAPTPNLQFPPWRKFQYDRGQFAAWNFRSVELSFLCCLSYRFLQRIHIACNTDMLFCPP